MKRKCNILDILDYDKMKIYENENFNSNDYFKVAIGPKICQIGQENTKALEGCTMKAQVKATLDMVITH
jgi:hypothetical protein